MLKTPHETRLRPVGDLSRGAAMLIGREESTQPVGRPQAASSLEGFSLGRWIVWVSGGATLGFAFPAAVRGADCRARLGRTRHLSSTVGVRPVRGCSVGMVRGAASSPLAGSATPARLGGRFQRRRSCRLVNRADSEHGGRSGLDAGHGPPCRAWRVCCCLACPSASTSCCVATFTAPGAGFQSTCWPGPSACCGRLHHHRSSTSRLR